MEKLNQSMIDEIIASAEEGSIESRVSKLEEEITEIKGSIKKLLIDIRETMSIIENPFQSIQSIAESVGGGKVQALQIIPPDYPESPNDIDEKKENEETKNSGLGSLAEESKQNNPKCLDTEDITSGLELDEIRGDYLLQKLKKITPTGQIDPLTLYDIIQWVDEMLKSYNKDTLISLIEVFKMGGYISDGVKEIVVKLIELISEDNNLDNAVVDLYRLYNILNPEDITLDSKILRLLLNNVK